MELIITKLEQQGIRLKVLALFVVVCCLALNPYATKADNSPQQRYAEFHSLTLDRKYPEAFEFLDQYAKSESRLVVNLIFGMMGLSTSPLDKKSDYELFVLLMNNQKPHTIVSIKEYITSDVAVLKMIIREGGRLIPFEIKMKLYDAGWLIHSTGASIKSQ